MWKIEFKNEKTAEVNDKQAEEIREILKGEANFLLFNNSFVNLKNVNLIYKVE